MRLQAKYSKVRDALLHEVTQMQPGARLPSQSELMKRFTVSYSTVVRALSELRSAGIVVARQGQGTFVAGRRELPQLQRKTTVGVALHLENWPFMSHILANFFEEAAKAGWAVLLPQQPGVDFHTTVSARRHANVERERIEELLNRGVDGIVMTSFDTHTSFSLDLIKHITTPVVFWGSMEEPSVSCVSIDDETAGESVTCHLLEQGYRRIGFVGARDEVETSYGSRRLAGYEQAMESAGLPNEFFEIPGLSRGGVAQRSLSDSKALCDLLVKRFDAVLAWSDHAAISLLSSLQWAGYRVPDDMAIVGFNDSPLCDAPTIDLTSLQQPVHQIAREAFDILRLKMENRQDVAIPMRRILPAKLIVRGSTRATDLTVGTKNPAPSESGTLVDNGQLSQTIGRDL